MKNTNTDIPEEDRNRVSQNFTKMLEEARVDLTKNLPAATVCLYVMQKKEKVTIGTLGDFSLIKGQAKSKKTFLITYLISEALGNLPKGKDHVLLFDTEQKPDRVLRNGQRILAMTSNQFLDKLHVFTLRNYSPYERRLFIEGILNHPKLFKDVGLVVIDGIRDLVTAINDESQATIVSTLLMKWTQGKNFHIITVLHENKSDKNARGHLGTELVNKAETVLKVIESEDDRNVSHVQFEFVKEKAPESFSFGIDENGIPYLIEEQTHQEKKTSSKDTKVNFFPATSLGKKRKQSK